MKIETKLALHNMKKNKKRTIFTTLSITICSVLIFMTMLCISSMKNGIVETIETEYEDYHFIIKNLDKESFYKIKEKEYIDKIYIQENIEQPLQKWEELDASFPKNETRNVYVRYKNVRNVCRYSTDIIQTLNLPDKKAQTDTNRYAFNQKVLTAHGLMDAWVDNTNTCRVRVNYSYVLDILIVVLLGSFSILFIIILYNAFLISINERKKEYAVLNSIGGTEGQILKMVFTEALIMGIVGMLIGGFLSIAGTNVVLQHFNLIFDHIGYHFKLVFDIPYIVVAIIIILLNLYVSVLIPSLKASTTSVIQGIRNTKQIQSKKRQSILERVLPIEGKLAVKNMRRNKNKYRVITILLVVCMLSYIVASTYICYEKQTAELVTEYDVDATLMVEPSCDVEYASVLHNYETQFGTKLETVEYKMTGLSFLVEPKEALMEEKGYTYEDSKKGIDMLLIGLEDTVYTAYINKVNADYGQWIIYNQCRNIIDLETFKYVEMPVFKTEDNLTLSLLIKQYNEKKETNEYELIDGKSWNRNFVLTDELVEGFSEIKTKYYANAVFVPMDMYDAITDTIPQNAKTMIANDSDTKYVKINCENIISFSNYLEDFIRKQDLDTMNAQYYSLENQEKVLYIQGVQLVLIIFILAIIIVGVISTINIINASFAERIQELKTLNNVGATTGNVRRMVIYECMYMFIKATILSSILSIPIVYGIIRYMENILVLNILYVPFVSIGIFVTILLGIALGITLCATRSIKDI